MPDGVLCRLGTTRFRRNGWSGQGSTAFLPDGTIFSCVNQSFTIWDATGKRLRTVDTEDFFPTQVLCSKDGRILVGVGRAAFAPGMIRGQALTLRVWSLPTLERRWDIELQQNIYRAALAITPDSKVLAVLGEDGDLDVYDLASGTLARRFHVPPFTTRWGGAGVPCVAFSPDGESIAYSGRAGYRISLWKWRSEAKVRDLPYTERAASSLVYSPDGKTIAAADGDGKWIRLWDVATGQLRKTIIPANLSYQPRLSYSENGKFLLASSEGSKAVYAFDATTAKCCRVFETAPQTVSDVAVSHDGRQLAVLTGQSLRLWDIGSGRALGGESGGHTDRVGAVAFSPTGSLVATASLDGTVRLWNPRTARQEHVLRHEHLVRAIAFSPDGRLLATSSYEDSVRVWDTASGRELFRLCGHSQSSYLALCFLSDGRRLASWGNRGPYLRIWDTRTGKALAEHRLHPSGYELLDDDDEVDDNPQAAMKRMQFQEFVRGGVFSSDGRLFVWLIRDQYHVFDVLSGQEIRKIPSPPQTLHGEIALSADGATLATAWYRWQGTRLPGGGVKTSGTLTIALVQLSTGKVSNLLAAGDSAPDGKTVAIAIYDKTAKLLDAATGQVRATLSGHTMEVRSVAFAPDNKTLATGSWDQQIKLWSLPDGKLQRTLIGHAERVYSVAFSPDGRTLAVAGMNHAALWDLAKGAPTIPLKGHGGSTIGWIEFSRDGRWVITAGWDQEAKIWDGKTGALRACFEGRGTLEQATLSPDGRLLAVCGRDGAVEVFEVNLRQPGSAEQATIAQLIRQLDDESYPVRENAEKALTGMTYLADARLRQALKESKSAEVRIRARRIVANMRSQPGKLLRGHTDALRTVGFAPDSKLLASGSMDGTIRLWDVESGTELAVLRLPEGTRNPLR